MLIEQTLDIENNTIDARTGIQPFQAALSSEPSSRPRFF